MPGRPAQRDAIVKAVQEGKLDVKLLDANVERILSVVVEGPRFKGHKFSNKPDLEAHASVAREAAAEGMVLLKNAGAALPLAPETKSVAAFGNASYDTFSGGTGSGDVNEAYTVSLAQGLERAGYAVNADLQAVYASYLKLVKAGRPGPVADSRGTRSRSCTLADLVSSMARRRRRDRTVGRNAGEGRDRTNTEGDLLTEASAAVQQVSPPSRPRARRPGGPEHGGSSKPRAGTAGRDPARGREGRRPTAIADILSG
jgi:beta-glucosidase